MSAIRGIETLKDKLNLGLLNKNPLPFELTIQKINEALEGVNLSHEAQVEVFLNNLNALEREHVTAASVVNRDVVRLTNLVRQGDYRCEIFREDHFGQLAFLAFKERLLPLNELATLLLRWEAYCQFGGQFQVHYPFDSDYYQFLEPALWKFSLNEVKEFKFAMENASRAENVFWSVTFSNQELEGRSIDDWAYYFFEGVGIVFPLLAFNQHPYRSGCKFMVIPSFTLYQTYLNTMFAQDAMQLVPQIFAAPDVDREVLQGRWPLMLNFPGLQISEKADGYTTGAYGVSHHDFYHAFRLSTIPTCHRWGFFRYQQILEHALSLSEANPNDPLLNVLWPQRDGTPAVISWETNFPELRENLASLKDLEVVASPYSTAWIKNRANPEMVEEYSPIQNLFARFPLRAMSLSRADPKSLPFRYAAFIHDMVVHKMEWQQHLGIDVSENQSRWKTQGALVAPTIYAGFTSTT